MGAPPTPLRQWGSVTINSWAFAQLAAFIEYKARRVGVPLVYVDPAYTSQECSRCHHIDKRNRPNQAESAPPPPKPSAGRAASRGGSPGSGRDRSYHELDQLDLRRQIYNKAPIRRSGP
ncbi:zinc ribbon domain-containing protein [Streptomyces sp. TLI_185]|uniref:zinc ribbon domain-containing protein n=1 Tax=Streptomyces sp. TLI_185 TaxID=2485151 RepID=UPI00288C3400|nr:zinc ribbon domain-containing protein [Streptomyces sp. TLI_185]